MRKSGFIKYGYKKTKRGYMGVIAFPNGNVYNTEIYRRNKNYAIRDARNITLNIR